MKTERGYPWLKLWTTYIEDPRFLRLSDAARARYFDLYILAGKADAGGLILAGQDLATVDDLAFILHREVDQVEAAIRELVTALFLTPENGGWSITRFITEQGPSMVGNRKKWQERQARRRAKLASQDQNQDQDEDSEEEEEEEVRVRVRGHAVSQSVTRDSHETHYTLPPPSADGLSSEELEAIWVEETGIPIDQKRKDRIISTLLDWDLSDKYYDKSARGRLKQVVALWQLECKLARESGSNWGKINPEALLERFPLPGMERIMQDKGFTFESEELESIRQRILKDFEAGEVAQNG